MSSWRGREILKVTQSSESSWYSNTPWLIFWTLLDKQSWNMSTSRVCLPWSGCSQQVLLFSLLLLRQRFENWQFLLVWRHLAGLVEDDEEDEDEDAHHWVTSDGYNGPDRQAHPQIMLHTWLDCSLHTQVTSHLSQVGHRVSLTLPSRCPVSMRSPPRVPAAKRIKLSKMHTDPQQLRQIVCEAGTFASK